MGTAMAAKDDSQGLREEGHQRIKVIALQDVSTKEQAMATGVLERAQAGTPQRYTVGKGGKERVRVTAGLAGFVAKQDTMQLCVQKAAIRTASVGFVGRERT